MKKNLIEDNINIFKYFKYNKIIDFKLVHSYFDRISIFNLNNILNECFESCHFVKLFISNLFSFYKWNIKLLACNLFVFDNIVVLKLFSWLDTYKTLFIFFWIY